MTTKVSKLLLKLCVCRVTCKATGSVFQCCSTNIRGWQQWKGQQLQSRSKARGSNLKQGGDGQQGRHRATATAAPHGPSSSSQGHKEYTRSYRGHRKAAFPPAIGFQDLQEVFLLAKQAKWRSVSHQSALGKLRMAGSQSFVERWDSVKSSGFTWIPGHMGPARTITFHSVPIRSRKDSQQDLTANEPPSICV